MKTRSGFVSNSSSSSFLILGKPFDYDEAEMKRILKRVYGFESFEEYEDYDDLRDIFIETVEEEYALGHEPEYIGIPLTSFSDGDTMDSFTFELDELVHMANEFADKFGFDPNDIRVMGGTEAC